VRSARTALASICFIQCAAASQTDDQVGNTYAYNFTISQRVVLNSLAG
jgi:hypothetical protein